jgi:hypothetical protein
MTNNCNKFDVKFDSCEEFKIVNFKIDAKDIENTNFNTKRKSCNKIRNSSSCSLEVILFIMIIALLARANYSNFNYRFYHCDSV